jgi:decaprenylphospho-beta-D-erythro-pentofuranosid-2-ulose 2-reductase
MNVMTTTLPAATDRVILVLGATSAIATAYCRRRAAAPGARFVLVGRQQERVNAVAADLVARGAMEAVTIASDLADMKDAASRFDAFCARIGLPTEMLLAYGVLGRQDEAEDDPDETRRVIEVNFTSAALWLQVAAKRLDDGQARSLIVIGSVAGDRGRRSNYVYGAAKAGLDAFAEGLAHRFHGTKLSVLTVKPGPVSTPMTAHFDRSGPLWATPKQVAAAIENAVEKKRRILYTPWFWRPIMTVIRFAPRALFYRTRL